MLWLFLVCPREIYGQDPYEGHFYTNRLSVNPAFVGSNVGGINESRIISNYKVFLFGKTPIYKIIGLSYDGYFEKIHGGIGIQAIQERLGNDILRNTYINGMYAYNMQITPRMYARGGLQFSYYQTGLKSDNLVLPSMIDPNDGTIKGRATMPSLQKRFFDVSAGITCKYRNNHFGLAVSHITEPNNSFNDGNNSKLNRKYTTYYFKDISFDIRGLIKEVFILSPMIMYQYQYNHFIQYGTQLTIENFITSIRFHQDFRFSHYGSMFLFGYRNEFFKFIYSYDFQIFQNKFNFSGGHEVTFLFHF